MEISLKEKLANDLKAALKEKQERKVSVLRMIAADVKNLEIQNRKPAADGDVLKILSSQARKHQDSITQFKSGNRPDLVAAEEEELAVIKSYLPAELGADELKKIIDEAISETGAASAADFGKAMKAVMAKAKGQADGQTVSQMLKEKLNGQ